CSAGGPLRCTVLQKIGLTVDREAGDQGVLRAASPEVGSQVGLSSHQLVARVARGATAVRLELVRQISGRAGGDACIGGRGAVGKAEGSLRLIHHGYLRDPLPPGLV